MSMSSAVMENSAHTLSLPFRNRKRPCPTEKDSDYDEPCFPDLDGTEGCEVKAQSQAPWLGTADENSGSKDINIDDDLKKGFEKNQIIFTHNFDTVHFMARFSKSDTLELGTGTFPQPKIVLDSDTLQTVLEKLRRLVRYANSTGHSLAVATGALTAQKLKEFDPIGNAIATIDPSGRWQWDAYCEAMVRRDKGETQVLEIDHCLPSANWSLPQFTLPIGESREKPPSHRVRKTFERRSKALQFLYKDPTITPENAKWFTINHVAMLPLVKAIDRMLAAIGTMRWGREKAKALMLQEEIDFLKSTVVTAETILYGIKGGTSTSPRGARKTSMVQADYILARKRARLVETLAPGRSVSADGRATWTEAHKLVSSYLAILRARISELELGRVPVLVEVIASGSNKVDLTVQDRAAQLIAIDVTKSVLSEHS